MGIMCEIKNKVKDIIIEIVDASVHILIFTEMYLCNQTKV